MKFLKYPALVLFVFSSFMAYSQELKPMDIDIFVNNFENIMNDMDEFELDEEYQSLGAAVVEKFDRLWYDDDMPEEEFNELIELYRQFVDYETPREWESVFNEAGWENKGHKKYFTVFFGTACIFFYLKNDYDETDTDIEARRLKLARIFGEHDLNIINSRMEDLDILF